MGTTTSSLHDLKKNEHLQRFVSKEPITPNDPIWNQLLSFSIRPPRTRDFTYALHVEAINTLLVLLSVQMFSANTSRNSPIYKAMLQGKCSIHALLFTKSLLQNFVRQDKCPESYYRPEGGGSIIIGLASGLWNVLTLGYGGVKEEDREAARLKETVLAQQSLLLLLVLVNHCPSDKAVSVPYKKALFSFLNSQDAGGSVESIPSFKLDYGKLYETLCTTLNNDQTTLLLYLLLHRNGNFKTYVLSRSNIELLMMPILKILYEAPERTSHHIYMSLIVLLILSEDDLFNEAVHDITLRNISWYTERSLSEISLGGLLILVVIRTIHFNMTRMRDKYLHTNCLAALANMSSHFKNLHPYVCQRFVSLFETLSKRLAKVMDQIQNNPDLKPADDDLSTDLLQDLSILEEVLRMILEIINSCLCSQLQSNPNLLYSLLYKRHIFDPFRLHPTFQDVVQNLDTVLSYFSSRLDSQDKHVSVHEVMESIKEAALHWPTDRLKKFPDLKFRYVEESQPEEFFIPYVWTIVYKCSGIPWSTKNLILFNPNKDL
ncbi:hypothetical protein HPB48_002596 [Haemaphysalis longicornis]|uniref:Dymeclin n=1 Tax=Haemaphysalis longicornis TaxID=44386 RepID=A0A9J6G0T7_HAELO|nr:hypothetical protein HPB48_002596 [Haemaphysalis longicornis]